MPPLTPLPPTSTPNPRVGPCRCWSVGSGHGCSSARRRHVGAIAHTSALARPSIRMCAGDRSADVCCDGSVTMTTPARRCCARWPSSWPPRRPRSSGAAAPRSSAPEPSSTPAVRGVATKSTPTDPVTVVDTETERLLRDRLAELRPGRSDPRRGGAAARRAATAACAGWSIRSTARSTSSTGSPAYAVSVGAQVDGVSVAGAVADVASRRGRTRRRWATARTCVARRRGDAAAVQRRSTICRWRWWAPGFGYDPQRRAVQARAAGRDAARWCATCAGSDRAHWICAWWPRGGSTPTTSTALHVWDWAAGALIAAEAGARGAAARRTAATARRCWWPRRRASRRSSSTALDRLGGLRAAAERSAGCRCGSW